MRELTPKGKKVIKLAVLLAVILAALLVYWAISLRNAPETGKPGSVNTVTPSGFRAELPYIGDGFSIDYLPSEDTYVVNIYRSPVEDRKAQARRFLERNGAKIPPSKIDYFLGTDVSEHTGP